MATRKGGGRVLFPSTGFTTADVAAYYETVAPLLLPHLRNRPLSFLRFPDDVTGDAFWEKDVPGFAPTWIRTAAIARRGTAEPIRFIVPSSKRVLTWLATVGTVELHPFLHSATTPNIADQIVFDLDPGPRSSIALCAEVALLLRDALRAVGLESWTKHSGSKGLQVYVPLHPGAPHAATESFARAVAELLEMQLPSKVTARMDKTRRTGRIFIDWSQNADFKTMVAVYSLRAKGDAPTVSIPLDWREVEQLAKGNGPDLPFDVPRALKRIRGKSDRFRPVLTNRQALPELGASGASKERDPEPQLRATFQGIALPRPRSQSGRRLFLMIRGETGDELWMERDGRFDRWVLRPDRHGEGRLIAMYAGNFPVESEYLAARVPERWQGRVTIRDAGSYEVIEGSVPRQRLELFFQGSMLQGAWTLEKNDPGAEHRSWSLRPRSKPSARRT